DLSLRMERHGHDQPALHDMQQPDPRRTAGTAIRRVPRSRILPVLCQQRAADLGPRSAAMSGSVDMRVLLFIALLIVGAAPAFAASEDDFKAAYAAAEPAEQEAGRLRNQWTTTEAALSAAKKAAASGDFDKAVASSKEA